MNFKKSTILILSIAVLTVVLGCVKKVENSKVEQEEEQ
jgi:hypothetical protein